MRCLAGLVIVAAFASVSATSSAYASHLQPSATAVLVDEGAAGEFRTVRIDVAGTCGPQAEPQTRMELQASVLAKHADPSKPPFEPPAGAVDLISPAEADSGVPGPAASFRYRIGRGIVAVARAAVECTSPPRGEFGEPEYARGQSPVSNSITAPWLLRWGTHGVHMKAGRRCRPPAGRLQVGTGFDFHWDITDLELRGVLGVARVRARDLRRIDLHISGGGRRSMTFHPSANGFRMFNHILLSGFYFIPRRAKPVRLWVTIGDSRSSDVVIRTRRRPRGC